MALHRAPAAPRRARRLAACALVVLVAGGAAACSSSKDEGSAPGTTTPGSTGTTAAGSTGSTGTTSGAEPDITSPSTLPTYDSTCAALAETYGLAGIQPKNTSSWVDERQRVVVDAQREAGLLGQAQQGAPADVAAKLAVLEAYAGWMATTVQGADSFSSAVSLIGAYPDMVGVSLAAANVEAWQKANCPE